MTQKIRTQEGSFWGYQALGERLLVSGLGIFSAYNDGNQRTILGAGVQFRLMMAPLLKIKYFFAYGDYSRRAQDLAPFGSAPPYAAFQSINYHSWGAVLEQNWGSRAKLVLESNFIYNRQGSNPGVTGVNALAELNYLITYHLSVRAVGFYSHNAGPGPTSYQVRSVSGGVSYRF